MSIGEPASVEIFEHILRGAVEAGASDIHLKVGGPVIFRVERTDRSRRRNA